MSNLPPGRAATYIFNDCYFFYDASVLRTCPFLPMSFSFSLAPDVECLFEVSSYFKASSRLTPGCNLSDLPDSLNGLCTLLLPLRTVLLTGEAMLYRSLCRSDSVISRS